MPMHICCEQWLCIMSHEGSAKPVSERTQTRFLQRSIGPLYETTSKMSYFQESPFKIFSTAAAQQVINN